MVRYMGAGEAASELGVSLSTLYSYVSRGLIRSEAAPGGGRERRYRAEDVERLKDRAEKRKDPASAGQGTLSWGTPVMESAVTLVDDERLYYRGWDVSRLCRDRSIEEVASLLWSGTFEGVRFGGSGDSEEVIACIPERLSPFERCQVALPVAAARDPKAYDLRTRSVIGCGERIMRLMAAAVGGSDEGSVSRRLAEGWRLDRSMEKLLDAAMILCADHELPVSTFAARCVASSGATPYAVVQAGLAALGGTRHGGVLDLVEAFFREVETSGAEAAISARLRRGESVPGFGHRLYPSGDPRAKSLLEMIEEGMPASEAVEMARELRRVARETIGEEPTVDFALVTLARAAKLPEGGALALFALGRTCGWMGHAIEQYESDTLIRPRARYVGEPVRPEAGTHRDR